MKFKIDENLPVEVAQFLRAAGYDALTVPDQSLGGSPDDNVARVCRDEQRVLVTLDTDFANVQAYPPSDYAGIIVLRLGRQDKAHVVGVLGALIPQLEQEPVEQRLWIVEERRIRIRE